MATQQDQEAAAKFFVAVFTLGIPHAYLAARLTYMTRWGNARRVERERAARALAVQAERERRYAAIGIVYRDIFDD
jgi:hypothetical protein